METNLKNRVVLVTGGSRGIGKAISRAFLECGATVIGIYAGNKTAADTFQEECLAFNHKLQLHKCDVSDETQVQNLHHIVPVFPSH